MLHAADWRRGCGLTQRRRALGLCDEKLCLGIGAGIRIVKCGGHTLRSRQHGVFGSGRRFGASSMDLLLATMLPTILIDVALGLVAFVIGFAVAMAYTRYSQVEGDQVDAEHGSDDQSDEAANEAARTNMAVQQLRDLAQNVAADVGAHNSLVVNISDQLDSIKNSDDTSGTAVRDAVARLLNANSTLQDRLADAERKIQIQSEELRLQQSEARTDSLTGLPNRRAFDDTLAENTERFHKSGVPFSLVLFDVDHFKKFNDEHGHQAGDDVLRSVGRTLRQVVKSGDLPCRYGGEEFAVIMANTKLADGKVAVERVRRAIEAMSVQFAGKSLRVTASLGLAECLQEETGAHVVRRADDGVYASKKAGRNCSHWNDGVACLPISAAAKSSSNDAAEAPAVARPRAEGSMTPVIGSIPDRAAFTDELRRRIAASHRSGEPLSLIHFRVRDYVRLETMYGSAVGTLLLDSLATFIASTLRDMDLLAKLDSGEFIVMLPGSSASAAKIVGQRVRSSISLCPIAMGVQQIRLDLDLGVVCVEPGDTASTAIDHAREALDAASLAEETARREAESSGSALEPILAPV